MPARIPGFSCYHSFLKFFNPLKTDSEHGFNISALDHVEVEDEWFDALENLNDVIPVTEDAQRCIKQLICEFGELKQHEIAFISLLKYFPAFPLEIVNAAYSLYTATMQGKNIDLAILNTLGLTSSYLLADGNAIAMLAQYIREMMTAIVGEYLANAFLFGSNYSSSDYLFTSLAVLAIAAKYYWRNDNNQPQRPIFRIPAFLGNIFLRATHYWNQLERLAQNAKESCEISLPDKSALHCVLEYNREQINERVSNRQSWRCMEKKKTHPSSTVSQ